MSVHSHSAIPRRLMPTLAVLRSFECAARHESFSVAAQELSLTQSAISRQIKELELAVGVPLFRRVGRRVQLTAAGAAFADELSVDLERLKQTVFRAIAAGDRNAALRVATLPTFASRWLIPRLPDFERIHPDIQVNLSTKLEKFDLAKEHVDLALHFGLPDWPESKMTKLFGETIIPVSSPKFRETYVIAAADDLLGVPLIHLETRPFAWNDWFARVGIECDGAIKGKQFSQFSMIIAATCASLGAALLPAYLIERELGEGTLVPLSDVRLITENAYYLVTPKGDTNPAVDCFAEWIISIAKDMS